MEARRTKLKLAKLKNDDLNDKTKMVFKELESAKSSIKCMNTGSITLDEILKSQKQDSSKASLGYEHKASTSKNTGKYLFIQRSTLMSSTPFKSTALVNSVPNALYRSVTHLKFTPKYHFCGIT